jgi:actin-related protein
MSVGGADRKVTVKGALCVRNSIKSKVRKMYFEERLTAVEISRRIKISRRSVSIIVKECEGFTGEREKRKEESKVRRKAAKREDDLRRRADGRRRALRELCEAGFTPKHEHDEAARVLSFERINDCFTDGGGYV